MNNLLPTKMNKKPAIKKLDILKNFLFAFSKVIPKNVSQKPKQIKIKGKNSFGSELFNITLNDKAGNNNAMIQLVK